MKRSITPALFALLLVFIFSNWTTAPVPLPTSMQITVLDNLGNIVEGAAVRLYLTEDDYKEETNQVGETLYTNKKGKVTLKKLEPRVYFLYVTKDDMNNIGGGVQTDTLDEGKVNKLNVIIE